MRKAAIEHYSIKMLDVFERVSNEAKREKNAVPPPNKMIYYWTRKPLIVGRAIALACTLEKPEDIEDILGLNKDTRAYKSIPNKTKYQRMLNRRPSEITVLDPFAGTGNLIFPSVELGLDVTCSDYNPLAHLITRGSLEIPATSKPNYVKKIEDAANYIIDQTEKEVGRFYSPHNLAYIWAWCITCSHCGQRIPLLNQMYLSVKKKIGLQITPTPNKDFDVKIIRDITKNDGKFFTQRNGKVQCIACHNTIGHDIMTGDIAKNKNRQMLAIQIQKPGRQGRDFILPTEIDRQQYSEALQHLAVTKTSDLIPTEEILASHRKKNTLWNYGITHWNQFFDDRQLLVLFTLMQKIFEFCSTSNTPSLKIYLSFLVAKFVDCYSYGVCWNSSGDEPEPTLAMRRPSIVFNIAEINPFEKVRGSLRNSLTNIVKAVEFCERLEKPALCMMQSVTAPVDQQYDLIITDPPYGNDVQYGELSEFFYLWMYKILNDKTLPTRVPLDEDFCESRGRFGDSQLAAEFFERGLSKSFVSINSKLKDDGLLAVFFAHSSIQAWNQLLGALRAGSLKVISSYSLHTENTNNPLARNKASFMSSIVIACRKITEETSGFIENVIPDMEDETKDMLDKIPEDRLLMLPITDLLIMVYGKVLESCTKHKTLKSRIGHKKPDFEMLLSNAQTMIMRLLVSRLTNSNINTIGPRMAFYILVKVFQGGVASADDMLTMTKACNIELSTLIESGVIEKTDNSYKILYLHKNDMDYPPENVARENLHQQICYLARQVYRGRANTINDILDKENFMRTTLKQLVHIMLKSYHMRKNRGDSLDINDREEIQVLETLADVMNIRKEGGLDAFVST